MDEYWVYHRPIAEHKVKGKPLGRHVKHDSRSRAHPYRRTEVPLKDNLVKRYIDILNQLQVGSCTGNAETGEIGSGANYAAFRSAYPSLALDETFALGLYSAAEQIDGNGAYPPNDFGSSGLSVAQAAKNAGYISAYVHCMSLQDVLNALSSGRAVILGTNWYDSYDHTDSNGLVTISPGAQVRGGHEYLGRGIDVDKRLVHCDNSWGTEFGIQGSFDQGWGDLERLLSEQGDGTISVPLQSVVPA
jgi:hypothetical protein